MFDVLIGILDGRNGCPVSAFHAYETAPICSVAGITETLPAGTCSLGSARLGVAIDESTEARNAKPGAKPIAQTV